MPYHVSRNGQTYGPYTLEELQRYLVSGNVLPTDLAKSEEMTAWIPVSQVLGVSIPVGPAPIPAYAGASPGYPAPAVYPDPPNLHWALVLLIAMFTGGLFTVVWIFVQAGWMRKVNQQSKALSYYIAAAIAYLIMTGAFVSMVISSSAGDATPSNNVALVVFVSGLASLVLFLVANFTMRSEIERHFNGPEPIGLSLSGIMTFFFSVLYFQYHFTRINDLKRQARYRGAMV